MFLTNDSMKLINIHKNSRSTLSISNKSLYQIYEKFNALSYQITTFQKYPVIRRKSPVYGFMNQTIENKIEQHTSCKKYTWIVSNGRCNISITLNIYQIPKKKVNINLDRVIDIISFGVSGAKDDLTIVIHFVPLKDKKILRKNQNYITVNNINSAGVKTIYPTSEICIFRIEEFSKVILHELQHSVSKYVIQNNNMINQVMNTKYNILTGNIIINESYIEIYARLLNAFYVSKKMPTNNYEYFRYLLNLEFNFSLYQMNKILQYNRNKKLRKIDDDTNLVAYYILTTEIFSDLENYIDTSLQKFSEYILTIPKIKIKKKINDNHMKMSLLEVNILY